MFLLDTNHCSRLLDSDPDVTANVAANSDMPMATSVITEGELVFMAQGSARKAANTARISAFLEAVRIFHVDSATAQIYGSLKADIYDVFGPKERSKRQHTTITHLGFSDNDLWIAAIALRHDLTIASMDSDFQRIQKVRDIKLTSWINGAPYKERGRTQ